MTGKYQFESFLLLMTGKYAIASRNGEENVDLFNTDAVLEINPAFWYGKNNL